MTSITKRTTAFCEKHQLSVPILLAPMAGACPPGLSIAVANAGGAGACGALMLSPAQIGEWAAAVRAQSDGPFQINLWIPDPVPVRDPATEAEVAGFLNTWGPPVAVDAGSATPPDFAAQCDALLAASPRIASSIMGLFPAEMVSRLKARGIAWFATATTVAEAVAAEQAGADAIVAQGMEAGGHRGCFDAAAAEAYQVGLFALLPAVVDAVRIPVVATGAIADARGIAAALMLGASAVQIGSGFLRSSEAQIHPAWADALAAVRPEDTVLTRAFSGRAGRSIETAYVRAAAGADAPKPRPYPIQRGLSAGMRAEALQKGDVQRMQVWAGQASGLARAAPAGEIVASLWSEAQGLLGFGRGGRL